MHRTVLPLVALAVLALPARAAAQGCGMRPSAPDVRAELRVTAAQLASQLRGRTPPVVLHVSMGRAEFTAGRVPGAHWVDVHAFVADQGGLAWEVPPIARLDSLIEAAGISDGARVVLYGDVAHLGRVFLGLEVAGLYGRVAVMDGGLAAWRAAGQTLATGPQAAPPRGRFTPHARGDLVVDAAAVRARGDRTRILDVRSPAEYAGTAREMLPRRGHIPGARLLDWTDTFLRGHATPDGDGDPGGGALRSEADLRRLFENAGAERGTELIVYCTIGMRAGHMYYVARYLGYDVKLYDGSWEDWSRRADLPFTQGPRP